MSSRRRIGVSVATTEAARRQLMQPVPCWEKVWTAPDDAPPGTTLKVYKWVKTDKKQTFSDDEDETTLDEPLAPLPDEPDANDGDEEDNDEVATGSQAGQGSTSISRAVSEPIAPPEPEEPVRKPHPLSMSIVPDSPSATVPVDGDALDAALKPLEDGLDVPAVLGDGVDVALTETADLGDITMASLGPDGTQFEGAGGLTQLQATDVLLGGEMMDQSGDPFTTTTE